MSILDRRFEMREDFGWAGDERMLDPYNFGLEITNAYGTDIPEMKYPSFRAINGRAPVAYVDFDPDNDFCQDDYEFFTGTGRYSDDVPIEDWEDDCPLDGDHDSALASCGWGTDEDYGYYGEDW